MPHDHFSAQPDAAKSGKESAALPIWLDTNSCDGEKETHTECLWKSCSTGVDVHMDVHVVCTWMKLCMHQLMGVGLVVIQTIN